MNTRVTVDQNRWVTPGSATAPQPDIQYRAKPNEKVLVLLVPMPTQAPDIRIAIPEAASMPSVDVATIGRVAGASVFLLCLLSLVLWLSFGLFFIAPLFSILGCMLGGSFYLLSFSVRREWANRDGRAGNRK